MDALLSRTEQIIVSRPHDSRLLIYVMSQLAYARFLPSDEWLATFFRLTEPHLAATAHSASDRSGAADQGTSSTAGKRFSFKVSRLGCSATPLLSALSALAKSHMLAPAFL
jgi:hypothetical protein